MGARNLSAAQIEMLRRQGDSLEKWEFWHSVGTVTLPAIAGTLRAADMPLPVLEAVCSIGIPGTGIMFGAEGDALDKREGKPDEYRAIKKPLVLSTVGAALYSVGYTATLGARATYNLFF